jgi:hypothetical protein
MVEKIYKFKLKKNLFFEKKKLFVLSMWKLTLGYVSYGPEFVSINYQH